MSNRSDLRVGDDSPGVRFCDEPLNLEVNNSMFKDSRESSAHKVSLKTINEVKPNPKNLKPAGDFTYLRRMPKINPPQTKFSRSRSQTVNILD